jgi:hypothetical protein
MEFQRRASTVSRDSVKCWLVTNQVSEAADVKFLMLEVLVRIQQGVHKRMIEEQERWQGQEFSVIATNDSNGRDGGSVWHETLQTRASSCASLKMI